MLQFLIQIWLKISNTKVDTVKSKKRIVKSPKSKFVGHLIGIEWRGGKGWDRTSRSAWFLFNIPDQTVSLHMDMDQQKMALIGPLCGQIVEVEYRRTDELTDELWALSIRKCD